MISSSVDISFADNGQVQLGIGATIRERRKAKGWDQKELGKQAGVNTETVNRAEHGANVTVDTLIKLARALGVEMAVAFHEVGGSAAQASQQGVSAPVSPSGDPTSAPGKEPAVVPFYTFPVTPYHVVLYGLIAAQSEATARKLWRPLLELVERLEQADTPPKPTPSKNAKH